MTAKILAGLVGLVVAISALNWLINPQGAAQSLGMPLLDGVGRSTQVGDFTAFFASLAVFCLLGILRTQATWLYAAATILGLAACVRTFAWLVHGADLAAVPIALEVIMTAMLLVSAKLMQRPTA